MLNVLVCVSGGGTNLQALIDAVRDGRIRNARIAGVISNNRSAYALERARQNGIDAVCLSPKDYPDRAAFNRAFLEKVNDCAPDLIVLAGFLVNIPPEMIRAYPNRIINIHPSLIPSFCGTRYYGLKVHEAGAGKGREGDGSHRPFRGRRDGYRPHPASEERGGASRGHAEEPAAAGDGGSGMDPSSRAVDLIAAGRVSVADGKTVIR